MSDEQLTSQDKMLAMVCHAGAAAVSFLLFLFGGFALPFVIWLTTKSAFVKANAANSMNFQITFMLFMMVSVVLCAVGIGALMLLGGALAYLGLSVYATWKASHGEAWEYPMAIRLFGNDSNPDFK